MKKPNYDIDDALLIKHLLGETNPEEDSAVQQWMQLSAANEKHFQQMKQIWEEAGTLSVNSNIDVDGAWQKFQQRIQHQPASSGKIINIYWRRWYAVAAGILLVAITAALWMNNSSYPQLTTVAAGNRILVDTLFDGSIITLNQYASVEYDKLLSGNQRMVKLKGEAFFQVTPDKEKPFVVAVNNAYIKVIGTSFNIKAKDSLTEVIVETGIVQVQTSKQHVQLTKGEKVIINNSGEISSKQLQTDKLYGYYRNRQFVCENTPLYQLVEALNEAYQQNIVLANESTGKLTITATFNNDSLDTILDVVAFTLNLTIERTQGKILLK